MGAGSCLPLGAQQAFYPPGTPWRRRGLHPWAQLNSGRSASLLKLRPLLTLQTPGLRRLHVFQVACLWGALTLKASMSPITATQWRLEAMEAPLKPDSCTRTHFRLCSRQWLIENPSVRRPPSRGETGGRWHAPPRGCRDPGAGAVAFPRTLHLR